MAGDRRGRAGALARAADADVLAALRDAVADDPEHASFLCGLLWQRHARVAELAARRVLRGRDGDAVADAVADAAERLARHLLRGGAPIANLPGLVHTMADRAARDVIRRRRPTEELPDDLPGPEGLPDPGDGLDALLGPLPERDRAILRAVAEDVPREEIARRLDITLGALYVAEHRARGRLRSLLEATR